jgi:hypothetical protein
MVSMTNRELREVTGREALVIDDIDVDLDSSEKEILGENKENNSQTATLAPLETEMDIESFTVDLEINNSVQPPLEKVETEMPAVDGHFRFGIVFPGGDRSTGVFGTNLNVPGRGELVVKTPR